MGYFGKGFDVWGEAHFDFLIEMLVAALCASGADWDNWRYHPTVWSIEGEKESGGASTNQKKTIDALIAIGNNKSELLVQALAQPSF